MFDVSLKQNADTIVPSAEAVETYYTGPNASFGQKTAHAIGEVWQNRHGWCYIHYGSNNRLGIDIASKEEAVEFIKWLEAKHLDRNAQELDAAGVNLADYEKE